MSQPSLILTLEPVLGRDISDCFDSALHVAHRLEVCTQFQVNGIKCVVRPSDYDNPQARELFIRNFRNAIVKEGGKICYANP